MTQHQFSPIEHLQARSVRKLGIGGTFWCVEKSGFDFSKHQHSGIQTVHINKTYLSLVSVEVISSCSLRSVYFCFLVGGRDLLSYDVRLHRMAFLL